MSLNLVSLVLLLIAKSHVIKLCQSVCQTSISDLTLKNHVIFSFSTADLNDCWHRCQSETRCQSLNFFTKHNLCEINNRTIELAANEDTAQTQFTAYFENPYRGEWIVLPKKWKCLVYPRICILTRIKWLFLQDSFWSLGGPGTGKRNPCTHSARAGVSRTRTIVVRAGTYHSATHAPNLTSHFSIL